MIGQTEIFSGVHLTAAVTEKFKSNVLSLTLLTPLSERTASLNALIPRVLRHGTRRFPGLLELNRELDRLYGCEISGSVFKTGAAQCVNLSAEFPDGVFLPDGADITERVIELLGDVLLFPATRGGRFVSEYVETERRKLIEDINAEKDDRQYYSRMMMERCMYKGTSLAVPELGTAKSAAGIGVRALTKQYLELLSASPIEIFYCGSEKIDRVSILLSDALASLPKRGERIRPAAPPSLPESELKRVNAELDTSESCITVGCRMPKASEERDLAVMSVYNEVLGGAGMSRLFRRLRDDLGLCYYAESDIDAYTGLLTITANADPEKADSVVGEIFRELDNMRESITPEELDAAEWYAANGILSCEDDPWALERFCFDSRVLGTDTRPETLASAVMGVGISDVESFARNVAPDTVCVVSGGGT